MTEQSLVQPRVASKRSGLARLSKLAPLLFLIGLWYVAAIFNLASDRLLPGPGEVAEAMWELLHRGYFYENLWATMRVIGIGMFFSLLIGMGLAIAIGTFPIVRDGVYPFIVVLNIVPKVALVPLLTIAMGYTARSRIIIVVLVAFFPVFLNTLTAIRDARDDRYKLMRSLGASRIQRLRMHILPEGAPVIFAGIKLSLTIAFIAAILAEFLIQRDGLAYLITAFRIALNTPMMYAVTITVAAIGAAMYLLIDRLERRVVFWERNQPADGSK